ncbi:GNAT family N-acetyltransferase [Brevundimonas sp.]|uniref:GNAT family N-acetyltransferase n=1 Tax=Brevundimonas sp. TaxID=1871086 RepID=UPI002FCB36E7
MIENLSIRPFVASTDTSHLSDIWFRASMIAHDFIGEQTLREQKPMMEGVYLPMATTVVACLDDRPVGFASLLDDHIAALFVDPDYQGKGIGKALLRHIETGRDALSLEVYLANEAAIGFYRAMGFKVVSQRETDDQGLPHPNAKMLWNRA